MRQTRTTNAIQRLIEPCKAPSPADRRRSPRFRMDGVFTDLGPVVDFSRHGMRVSTRAPSQLRTDQITVCEIRSSLDRTIVGARVAWVRRVGLLKRHVGFEFVKLTPRARDHLRQLALAAG